MKRQTKLAVILCMISLLLSIVSVQTSFASNAALTLEYDHSGTTFHVYYVADENGNLAGEFAGYQVSLDHENNAGLQAAANALAAYAARDAVKEQVSVIMEKGGMTLTGLKAGWYLVTGTQNRNQDSPVPSLLYFSGLENVTCKIKEEDGGDTDKAIDIQVKKVWSDPGREHLRPESVEVQLLKNGAIYGTVSLNKENGWCYTWKDVDARANWQVTENAVPSRYTVSVSRDQDTFTVTNTYKRTGSSNTGSSTSAGNTSHNTSISSTTGVTVAQVPAAPMASMVKLPQTGQLWWPVPILAFCGILMFAAGWIQNRKWSCSHER